MHCSVCVLTTLFLAAAAQGDPAPARNENLGESWLASDGSWCAYLWSGEGGKRLQLVNLKTNENLEIVGAERPEFSSDCQWLTYRLANNQAALRRLANSNVRIFDPAPASLQFLGGGKYLLVQHASANPGIGRIMLLDLMKQEETTAETSAVAVQSGGALVAWIVSTGDGQSVETDWWRW